jgi:integrase/recombinase XerD
MINVPAIQLIPISPHQASPLPPTDLRSRSITEFFQSQSLAPKTRLAYERELKRFLNWTDKSWSAIAPRQIAQYKAHLSELGLAQASINRALCSLKSFFAWLHKAYPASVPTNPTVTVELEKLPVPEARDLSPEQIKALWQAIEQLGATQLTVLKQKSSPNKAQTSFISDEYVTILVQPFDKTIRNGCTKSL